MNDKLEKSIILQKNPWLTDVKIVAESESTQKDAKLDGQENCLYLTERQNKTYGRFGRQYFAAPSGGIYMSLSLKPKVELEKLPEFTLLTGAAIVSAIEKLTDKKPQIKWVNDIYLDDKKFVGILAETSLNPTQEAQVIIGISRSELIAEIWSEFHRLSEGSFFQIYKSHSFILGKQVEFVQSGQTFSGRATDLTSKGELIVNLDNGQQKILSSGEISLKKWT